MRRAAPSWTGRCPRGAPHGSGYSLVETMASLVVMSVLIAMGVPRFQLALEQSRANVAGANLRAVWSAQRIYWLEHRGYAPDLWTLQSESLIDPSLVTATAPYAYSVAVSGDGSTFTATATRGGVSAWSGSFTIATDGSFTGSVQQAGHGTAIAPQFQ